MFLDMVQYKRREYENRNKIRTKDGWVWLTVPVVSKGLREQLIGDVMIDNSTRWQEKHWRAMSASYKKARFFSEHAPFFENVYLTRHWESLQDLNVCTTMYVLEKLGITVPVHFESQLGTTQKSTERIIEICRRVGADVYLSGSGGRGYLEEKRFEEEGIELRCQDFRHPVYRQVYAGNESGFIPEMAAADLLFNEGPDSRQILEGEARL